MSHRSQGQDLASIEVLVARMAKLGKKPRHSNPGGSGGWTLWSSGSVLQGSDASGSASLKPAPRPRACTSDRDFPQQRLAPTRNTSLQGLNPDNLAEQSAEGPFHCCPRIRNGNRSLAALLLPGFVIRSSKYKTHDVKQNQIQSRIRNP